MKTNKKFGGWLIALLLITVQFVSAQNNYYFTGANSLDSKTPSPEQYLGYPVGSYYTRHDQVVNYLKELARVSDRIHVQVIGKTYEQREQIIVTATSPQNYSRLEQIRQEHLNQIDPSKPVVPNTAPVIIDLGYGVHGNETSSTEVSLLIAYYLAASNDPETQKWLSEAVIFIDPSLNPDGRDRAANWHNQYHSYPAVGDPLDKEHVEGWPAGRANHLRAAAGAARPRLRKPARRPGCDGPGRGTADPPEPAAARLGFSERCACCRHPDGGAGPDR